MTVAIELSCLFCETVFETEQISDSKKTGALNFIHEKLCSALKLVFPLKCGKWNFATEPFPYCLSCQKIILRLCRLIDQVKTLEQEVSRCVSTLSMLTITSKCNSATQLQISSPERPLKAATSQTELLEKYNLFRRSIFERFNVRVRLKRCAVNQSPLIAGEESSLKSGISQTEATDIYKVSEETDAHLGSSRIFQSGSSEEDEAWNDSCPTPLSVAADEKISLASSIAEKAVIPEEPATTSKYKETVDLANEIPPKQPQNRLEAFENQPEEAETCELDIKIDLEGEDSLSALKSHLSNTEDIEDNATVTEEKRNRTYKKVPEITGQGPSEVRVHSGFKILIARTKCVCLKCDSKFVKKGGKSALNQAKAHINFKHVAKNIVYVVRRVDEKTYKLNGFEFKEIESGYECSTCEGIYAFAHGIRAKWTNVKNHIQDMHLGQKQRLLVKEAQRDSWTALSADEERQGQDNSEERKKAQDAGSSSLKSRNKLLRTSVLRYHSGFSASVTTKTATCTTCGLEFRNSNKGASWFQVKRHIEKKHVPTVLKSSVRVLDPAAKTFHINGFEFKELKNGYECSTCKTVCSFPVGALPGFQNLLNIKKHILLVHARSKYGRCDICNKDFKHLYGHMYTCHRDKNKKKTPIPRMCEVCGKEFKSIKNLGYHKRQVHKKRPKRAPRFQCDVCEKKFTTKFNLAKHRVVHTGEKPYACEHCEKTFAHQDSCKSHVASVHGERKYACEQCDRKFWNEQTLARHEDWVHIRKRKRLVKTNYLHVVKQIDKGLYDLNGFGFKELDKGFQCSTCDKTLPFSPRKTKWKNVAAHIIAVHIRKKSKSSAVETNDEVEVRRDRVQGNGDKAQEAEEQASHSQARASPQDASVKPLENSTTCLYEGFKVSLARNKARCLTCGLQFDSNGEKSCWRQAQLHIKQEHAPSRTKYKVEVVDKDTKTFHVVGYEFQEEENGYECSTCKTKHPFSPKNKLINVKRHILKVHARYGRGRCSICKKVVENLSYHLKSVHGDDLSSKTCEFCGQEFQTVIDLATHRRALHWERPKLDPKFQCAACGKTFTKKANFNSHKRIHEGEKPYICEHCGKQFRFKHVLKTHVASAHGERKFACDQCDWKFGVKFLLTRHVKQVHEGIKPPPSKKRKKGKEPREESEVETSESDSDATSAGEQET